MTYQIHSRFPLAGLVIQVYIQFKQEFAGQNAILAPADPAISSIVGGFLGDLTIWTEF